MIHPDFRVHCTEIIGRLMSGEDVGLFDVVFQARSGRAIHLEGNLNCRRSAGSVVATRGIFRDVTQRRLDEKSSGKRDAMLHALRDNLPGGAVYQMTRTASGELHCDYLSGGIVALCGLTASEVLAEPRKVFQCIHPEDMQRWKEAAKRSSEQLSTFDAEVRYRNATGELCWVHSVARPTRTADGGTRWDGLISDISERRRTEEALRHQT